MCMITGLIIQPLYLLGDGVIRWQVFIQILRYYGTKAAEYFVKFFLPLIGKDTRMGNNNQYPPQPSPIGEGVSNSHPEVSGSHQLLIHRGKSDVQHDANPLKRTCSSIHLFTHSLHKKAAFTLAEVLITLGIIGVVAAMTMPVLVQNVKNKELQVQFKKTYSELSRSAQKFYADEGISFSEYSRDVGSVEALKYFLKNYFKGATVTDKTIWGGPGVNGNPDKSSYSVLNFNGSTEAYQVCDISGLRSELGGRLIAINEPPKNSSENGPILCVDINGYKAPNRAGKDYFLFLFTVDGSLIPMGTAHKSNPLNGTLSGNASYEGNRYCRDNSGDMDQYSCAYYALADIHPQDSGKTYWKDFINKR